MADVGGLLLRFGMALAALCLTLGMVLASGPAAAAASPETRVKAAYLYKLASFVRWPDAPRGEFRVCVAGSNETARVLEDFVRGERVMGLPIGVETLDARQASRVGACQVLFLARGPQTARTLLAAADGRSVLTVADRDAGTRGGVIDFVIRDGKVRFMIDRGRAQRQGLELSSKLLDIALAVER